MGMVQSEYSYRWICDEYFSHYLIRLVQDMAEALHCICDDRLDRSDAWQTEIQS